MQNIRLCRAATSPWQASKEAGTWAGKQGGREGGRHAGAPPTSGLRFFIASPVVFLGAVR